MSTNKKNPAASADSARRRALALLQEHFPEVMVVVARMTPAKTTKIRMDYSSQDLCVLTSSLISPYLDLIDAGGGVSVSHESEYDTSTRELSASVDDDEDDED